MIKSKRFWISPISIIIFNYGVEDYQRQYLAFIVQSVVAFLGHAFFYVLTRPTKGNNAFPYHVKTNKIGLMLPRRKESETQNFPHHEDDNGGNTQFTAHVNTFDLFVIKKHGEKYIENT